MSCRSKARHAVPTERAGHPRRRTAPAGVPVKATPRRYALLIGDVVVLEASVSTVEIAALEEIMASEVDVEPVVHLQVVLHHLGRHVAHSV